MKVKSITLDYIEVGANAGVLAAQIRTSGCNLTCGWCASDERMGHSLPLKQIVAEILAVRIGWVRISGGEPLWQSDTYTLLRTLRDKHYLQIHLETNGTIAHPLFVEHLVILPKLNDPPQPSMVSLADEIRIPLDDNPRLLAWAGTFTKESAHANLYVYPRTPSQASKDTVQNFIKGAPAWRLLPSIPSGLT